MSRKNSSDNPQLLPFPNARLVAISPSAGFLLSYHPPILRLHVRESGNSYRQKAFTKRASVTAISLTDFVVLGTAQGALYKADSTLAVTALFTLLEPIRAVSHTKNFVAAATRSAIFVVRGRNVVSRMPVSCVSALTMAEWHAVGEVKRRASLAYLQRGKVAYIPDLNDGCKGRREIIGDVRYVRIHQTRHTDFLYVVGEKTRIFEVDMRGEIHSGETLDIAGDVCAEWMWEGDGRTFLTAKIEGGIVKLETKKLVKGVRFQRESAKAQSVK